MNEKFKLSDFFEIRNWLKNKLDLFENRVLTKKGYGLFEIKVNDVGQVDGSGETFIECFQNFGIRPSSGLLNEWSSKIVRGVIVSS
ncbi:MAG: hypothetical protein GY749_09240 [Desulfobacteraceae bacterium]|nr:hypothetical protein [Desulfobacteraceae bacterium]